MSVLYQSYPIRNGTASTTSFFVPKRRRKVIVGQTRRHLGEIFHALARQKECHIIEGHLMPDHVHMCIAIGPVGSRSVRWTGSTAATASPSPAKRSHVHCRFPRNRRPVASRSTSPAPNWAALFRAHRKQRHWPSKNCRSHVHPKSGSDARRQGDSLASPTPKSESTDPLFVLASAGC